MAPDSEDGPPAPGPHAESHVKIVCIIWQLLWINFSSLSFSFFIKKKKVVMLGCYATLSTILILVSALPASALRVKDRFEIKMTGFPI